MERRTLISILTVAFLALSSLGFVVSLGSFKPPNFTYQGTCLGTVKKVLDTEWIVYTLQDVNIPGTPTSYGIRTVPTPEVRSIVEEKNLLYWTNALVEVNVEGRSFTGDAFVLGNRKVGDEVLLDCYLNVQNGTPVEFTAVERPPAS